MKLLQLKLLGKILAALVLVLPALVCAPASAQTYGDSPARGNYGGSGYGAPSRGGSYRGGPFRRGFQIGPGILLPALGAAAAAAAAADEENTPPPRRHRRPPRHTVAQPHPIVQEAPPPKHFAKKYTRRAPARKNLEKKPVASALLNLPARGETRLVAKEVLVAFKPGVSDKRIAALARRRRLQIAQFRDLALLNQRVYRFRYADDRPLDGVLWSLARETSVASVQPDYVYALAGDDTPASPAPAAYAPAMLRLPEAHHIATGKDVRVALIDGAIDASNPEIAGAVAATFDASGAAAAPSLHGVGMASAIAGRRQIDGAAPAALLLAAQAFDDSPGAQGKEQAKEQATGFNLLAALDWAVAQKARVVNMSFAGPADPLFAKMLAAAAGRGIVLVAAAGNDGPGAAPAFPGADAHVIAVSAVDDQSRLYARANRGSYVDLAAPGVDVLVAAPGGAYDLSSGTSVACAEVSGIAALLLQEHPGLDGPALRRLLRASARKLENAPEAGAGLADAQAALRRGL
ncbi:S8 family serine peptidase [Rhodoblastus acidophilus]|uniref:S8 family serine peptidase n=1 Tax=Candidatus Rhodoblastus alkanivorans TaxID=2954117 RepID=A0ABS9Z2G5_9HYPH|nr:S8 family serine peptidase [Candidatus Rhodoblastus alkanivorans]MCI4677505.1 S8 family serine peptidase [Candidatus Rhodoblastus alkanivorans]MCI4681864.1 S8 family serine peptidase [Candidatus Rhodoblastus alkanivorans]MDI4642914.1 S8 family serine peptidase [Rhodoblastus acidophilus]